MGDAVKADAAVIGIAFRLRPAEELSAVHLFFAERAARAQPDRDGLRIEQWLGEAVEIRRAPRSPRAPPWVVGPDGSRLPVDGEAIRLDRITTAVTPTPPVGGEAALCQMYVLKPEIVPVREIDTGLRERLRALGYMD